MERKLRERIGINIHLWANNVQRKLYTLKAYIICSIITCIAYVCIMGGGFNFSSFYEGLKSVLMLLLVSAITGYLLLGIIGIIFVSIGAFGRFVESPLRNTAYAIGMFLLIAVAIALYFYLIPMSFMNIFTEE